MAKETSEGRAAVEEQIVVFRLTGEHYGVDIGGVREIITWQPVTRIPKAPRFMEGVLNLRGSVIPVIDLRKQFELPELAHGDDTRIMVVEIDRQVVGLVVDAVTEVLRVAGELIEPPAGFAVSVDATFLRGVAKVGDRLIVLLELDELLQPRERSMLEKLAHGEPDTAPAPEVTAAAAGRPGRTLKRTDKVMQDADLVPV